MSLAPLDLRIFAVALFAIAGAPSPGDVKSTVPMSAARAAHSATTLGDGRVLVVGGFTSDANVAAGAEAFVPSTARYTALPRMITLRHSHSATLLPDGRVLIAGGYAAGNSTIANAELFDPKSNTFTATGSMRSARAGHVAVLLGNGKVLVAGGVGNGWSFLGSAELYDPSSGTFTPTGNMTVARESHVAVKLVDGRVLIVGGHRDRRATITIYSSAEAYDPRTNTFTSVGDMRVRRHKHDAVLLADGRVLVTGGSDERDDKGAYRSTELFDPATNTFAIGPTLTEARYKHHGSSILLPSGDVLIAGGAQVAERYNAKTGVFTAVSTTSPLAGQFAAAAAMAGGQVLINGGYGMGRGPQALSWVYRP